MDKRSLTVNFLALVHYFFDHEHLRCLMSSKVLIYFLRLEIGGAVHKAQYNTVDKAIMHRAIMHKSHNALVLGVDGVGSYLNQPLLNIEY